MKTNLFKITLVIFTFLCTQLNAQDKCTPQGWATQNGGTTGGGSNAAITVTTISALKTQASSTGAKVIYVSGTMGGGVSERIVVSSNKTIIGMSGATINGGFDVKDATNVIIRNLTVKGPGSIDVDGVDCITVQNSTNVWLDHLTIQDGQDGNLDVVNGSNYVSITWCKFLYTSASSNHQFNSLFGNSDSKTSDRGKLKITLMNNWYTSGCAERMPRVRFGQVHVVNNLFDSPQASHCVRAGIEADILVEGNVFRGVKKPIDLYENNFKAVTERNNSFLATTGNKAGSGISFTPPYTLLIANVNSIEAPIKSCAGATLANPTSCSLCGGTVPTNTPPTVTLTGPTNNSTFIAPATIVLSANAADANGTVSNVQFYNGTTLLATDATAPYSFSWTNVPTGNYSITAKATDNAGAITTSSIVSILVNSLTTNTPPIVSLTSPANNATFTAPASISIAANASDANGTVSNVQFYNGSTLLATDATAPYSFSWTNVATGTYTITAKATDNAGASTTSASVTISTGTVTTSGINSVNCGTSGQVIALQLSNDIIINATLSSWWFTGPAGSIAAVAGTVNKATLTTGNNFGGGDVCVGVNYNAAPYWKQYCKTINLCNGKKASDWAEVTTASPIQIYPNPSEESFTISSYEGVETAKVYNLMGEEILKLASHTSDFGKELKAGTYMLHINYSSGKKEIIKIVKLR